MPGRVQNQSIFYVSILMTLNIFCRIFSNICMWLCKPMEFRIESMPGLSKVDWYCSINIEDSSFFAQTPPKNDSFFLKILTCDMWIIFIPLSSHTILQVYGISANFKMNGKVS